MNSNYVFTNQVSAGYANANIPPNYSWIQVDNNAGRPLYAQASYITNLDGLTVALTAGNVNIGDVHIADPITGLHADVANIGAGQGALRVLTQSFDSIHDTVSLGDINGNNISVTNSALNVFNTNPISSISINNPITAVQVLNPVSAFSLTNQITSISVTNFPTQLTAVSVTNFPTQLTAVSVTNQLTGLTILNPVTAVTVNNLSTYIGGLTSVIATASNQVTTNSLLNALTGNNATGSNQVTTNTLLNSVTANQATQITLEKTLSANSVYGTSLAQPSFTTVTNPVTSILVSTNSNTLSVSGAVTVTNAVSTTPIGTQNVTFADSPQIDEASRLRVAIPQTQWWYIASIDKDGDLRYNESFVAGASSIFVQNLASVNMTSGTTSVSGQAIRASRRRHKIIPGNSHEYIGVWNWDGQQANVVKRIGIFTQFNGYFFELSGTNAMNAVVRRRLPDGTMVEERVNQTNWNGDKLDGTGPNGENWNTTQTATITSWVSTTPISIQNDGTVYNVVYTLSAGQVQNFRQGTKATITGITPSGYNAVAVISNTDTLTNRLTATYLFNPGVSASNASAGSMVQTGFHMQHTYWIDFMGGRTNRVRFGKISDYGKIVLHTFRFDGLLGTAYENAPTLTERKEIFNIGSVTSLPSFTVMGNAFNVEANVDITPNFNMARNDAGVTIDTGQEFPILGVGLRAGEPYQRADIQIQNIAINDVANSASGDEFGTVSWRLVLNPSIQGALPSPTNIGKASRQWAYTTSNTVSGGIDLMGGYLMSKTAENLSTALNFLNMGSNIDNTDADKVVLVAKLVQKGHAASNIVATMNFIEAL